MSLIELAMRHRSSSANSKEHASNERLEYLGDALIGLVVANDLYKAFPEGNEGFLTRARARVVCRETLNQVAHHIGLTTRLNLGTTLKENADNVYGNALEALVGAIYLDGGYSHAAAFVRKNIVVSESRLRELAMQDVDYKSRLLEWAQANKKTVEFVQLADQYDSRLDAHRFVCEVTIDSQVTARASGTTKKLSQQNAAKKSLQVVKLAQK